MRLRRLPIVVLCVGCLSAMLPTPAASRSAHPPLEALLSSAVTEGSYPAWDSGRTEGRVGLAAQRAAARVAVGKDVNVIGRSDVVEQVRGASCTPGKQTAQNETALAVNPQDPNNLVGGANDYRLYSRSQHRYDGSGGFYRSTDGGKTWTVGMLPGLVKTNPIAPGPYEATGDPAISTGPNNVFWYANIAFKRDRSRSGIAVSRSADGGATWKTTWVIRGKSPLFHDKEWIAGDPADPNVAYVTWTQFDFQHSRADIVVSKTVDAGATWSPPVRVSTEPVNQGSVPMVDDRGFVHVVYAAGAEQIAHARSVDGGTTWLEMSLYEVETSVVPGVKFRVPFYLPGFAIDGPNFHIVYTSWNGNDSDILYIRSPNYGLTWLPPVTLSTPDLDQFFPWVSARAGVVYAGWFERVGSRMKLRYMGAASPDNGLSWTAGVPLSTRYSDAGRANRFRPDCGYFYGDYTAIAVGSDGVAHALWPDARDGNSRGDPGTTADQDPYTARFRLLPE